MVDNEDYAGMALEYPRWIKLAEQKNLFLSPETYNLLTKNREYEMVEIDYMNFLFQERPKKYKPSKVYSAQELYKKLIHKISPTMVITTKIDDVAQECAKCDGIAIKQDVITNYGLKSPDIGWDFYTVGESKWLITGNGDNLTRWMLWTDLLRMPNIYYRKTRSPNSNK